MSRWKLHTPEGVQDILQEECMVKKEIEGRIAGIFQSWGYCEVQPPTFEFYDVFAGESGLIKQETMFKFFDHQGRILVLRPDITTPIARIVATKLNDAVLPIRMYYIGNAFRYDEPYQGARLREFTQAGIEMIGTNTPESDAEAIAVTIQALLASGLKDFQIDIGQVEFFKGLMEQTGLDEEQIEKIRVLIDSKDSLAIEELVASYDIDEQLKSTILNLPSFFGGIEIIDRAEKEVVNERAIKALENIREVYNILLDYGVEKYISIDLGMVQSLNYYTGIIFKGFTHGLGFPVCSGGRYDGLINEFGKNMPAIGVAIGINRLMSSLDWKEIGFNLNTADTLINYIGPGRKKAFQIAQELRNQGLAVEIYPGECSVEDILPYARSKKFGGIITIYDGENIELYNLDTDKRIKTTVSSLLVQAKNKTEGGE